MEPTKDKAERGNVIATIHNSQDADQKVDLVYVRERNAFVTSGISRYYAEREILIPSYLVAADLEKIGAIVSAILEKLSKAVEQETVFQYAPEFEVLGGTFTLTVDGEYVRLDWPWPGD